MDRMKEALEIGLKTALELAWAAATDHLSKARAVKSANIAACVEYLRAAQSAITGLEDEADEILVEAKMVALFFWDKRAALYERIDSYLTRDRLRPLLDQAIKGIDSCRKFAERDSEGFFSGRTEKADVVAEVRRLLDQLHDYMASLGSMMDLSRENYVSPSGISMPRLLDIQERLKQPDSTHDHRRSELVTLVKEVQRGRVKPGLPLVADCVRVIQELTVVFGLQRRGDG